MPNDNETIHNKWVKAQEWAYENLQPAAYANWVGNHPEPTTADSTNHRRLKMSDQNLTRRDTRDLQFLKHLETLVANSKIAANELAGQVRKDPASAVKWCRVNVETSLQGQEAASILEAFLEAFSNEKDKGTAPDEALKEVVKYHYRRYQKELLGNSHRANSTCPYTNAVTESRREVVCKMIHVLDLHYWESPL